MAEKLLKGQWSARRAAEWQKALPWIRGCNYVPSNCTDYFEFWQEYDFENRLPKTEEEIALAADIGFNALRMGLDFEVWNGQREGFLYRLDKVLGILEKRGMKAVFWLGNDCTVDRASWVPKTFGKPPEPARGYHGGVKATPFSDKRYIGFHPMDDAEMRGKYYEFACDMARRFGKDGRILFWNLWNEPGNNGRDSLSLPYMREFFRIFREENVVQPLAADAWSFSFSVKDPSETLREIEKEALRISDVISFHFYGNYPVAVAVVKALKAYERPMFCTEWLHRLWKNRVQEIFPLFWLEGIGSFHWGLVAGRAQHYEPWENLRSDKTLDFSLWQHDIFRENGRPYDPKEIEIIKYFCEKSREK